MKTLLTFILALWWITLAIPPEVVQEPFKRPPTASECMAVAIHDEARGEPRKGARAVLDVILKRMKMKKQTACEIVLAEKQFSGMKPYMLFDIPEEVLTNYEIVAKMQPVFKNCTHFHATYVIPKWAQDMRKCGKIGKHIFYEEIKKEKRK